MTLIESLKARADNTIRGDHSLFVLSADRIAALEADKELLEVTLNSLLNDCINFDGGKLTDCIIAEAALVLKRFSDE